jgi:protein-S-isoprenylcysteine O-methyltransferase Ste14
MISFSFSFLRGPVSVPWRGTKLHDLASGLLPILAYGVSATGRVRSLASSLSTMGVERLDFAKAIGILSDIAVLSVALLFVIFISLRPPAVVSAHGLMPRIAAAAGTYLGVFLVLAPASNHSEWIAGASVIVLLCGMAFAAYSLSYLGRSVSLVAEARKLVTGGPYRLVRHPLYLGEEVAIAGVSLQHISIFTAVLFAVQIAFQLYRMSCEEKILAAAFPEYDGYAKRTFRILPWVY